MTLESNSDWHDMMHCKVVSIFLGIGKRFDPDAFETTVGIEATTLPTRLYTVYLKATLDRNRRNYG
jgi:hypothetical protein